MLVSTVTALGEFCHRVEDAETKVVCTFFRKSPLCGACFTFGPTSHTSQSSSQPSKQGQTTLSKINMLSAQFILYSE